MKQAVFVLFLFLSLTVSIYSQEEAQGLDSGV